MLHTHTKILCYPHQHSEKSLARLTHVFPPTPQRAAFRPFFCCLFLKWRLMEKVEWNFHWLDGYWPWKYCNCLCKWEQLLGIGRACYQYFRLRTRVQTNDSCILYTSIFLELRFHIQYLLSNELWETVSILTASTNNQVKWQSLPLWRQPWDND